MLEGLEISILLKSELENQFTIGAEFYGKEFVSSLKILKSSSLLKIRQLCEISNLITDGDHGAPNYQEEGVLYLLSESIKEGYIDENIFRFIKPELHVELKRSALFPGDVVVTKTGIYFGKSAVIPEMFPEANTSAHVGKISVKKDLINPYYLAAFINSSFGYLQFRRRGIKATRPEIKLIEFDDIKIGIPSVLFQCEIESLNKNANRLRDSANKSYSLAETILMEALGLDGFEPTREPINIKSFSESFGATGRLDAEYYQKKYEQIIEKIKSGNYARVHDVVSIKKSIEPGSDVYDEEGQTPFLRVADYNKFGITTPQRNLSDHFVQENKELIEKLKPKAETILFSKDGSVGTAYMLKEDADFITSGAVLHLRVKDKLKILPEYITLVFNSLLVQLQAERDAGGSIILHWRINEIENVLVPVIDLKIQQQISEKITESFRLKQQSERLLELARRAVELAVETDEAAALALIEEELQQNRLVQ